MKFNIRGSKLEITDAIKSYIETKIGKLNKYFETPDDITANVVAKTYGIKQVVEVTIVIPRTIIRAEESSEDLYASIDLVYEKLERQIRKQKTRIGHRKSKEVINDFVDFEVSEAELDEGKIAKRKVIDSKPMSEEEAILQMELLGHDFFIFNDSDTTNTAVLYKRKDGDYGIIEVK